MPRYKKYDYSQSQLLPVNFNEQILPGTLDYTIHCVVDNKINLSRLEKRFRNEETGAPAYDPRILLKIGLMAYSRGVVSSRRIERLCRENVIFNATHFKIRGRLGAIFKKYRSNRIGFFRSKTECAKAI